MRKVLRVIAKLIWFPFVILRDYAENGYWPSLKAVVEWIKETRTKEEIEHCVQVDIWSKRK